MDDTTASGTVKWYDAVKGYGFIARDDGGDDLFVHRSAVGYEVLNEGDQVSFTVIRGLKGANAEQIQVIARSTEPSPSTRPAPTSRGNDYGRVGRDWSNDSPADYDSLPLVTGTIKRYDPDKGYGFVSPDDGSTDVFIHRSAAGVATIGSGDRIEFRLGRGPKGPRAEQVRVLGSTRDTAAGWAAHDRV